MLVSVKRDQEFSGDVNKLAIEHCKSPFTSLRQNRIDLNWTGYLNSVHFCSVALMWMWTGL